MDENTRRKIYAALAAPFPESCVQRSEGRLTGRGYDTTGIGYQWIANRLNEVLGLGGFRIHRTVTVREIQRPNGRTAFEANCDLTLELGEWIDGEFKVFAESLADGGGVSASEADARKSATSAAFKKAAAFHGVGRQSYEGTLDDDNAPEEATALQQPTMTVVRAPVSSSGPAAVDATPPGFVRTPTAAEVRSQTQERNRLSSKQLAAVWSMARKLRVDQSGFRAQVKQRYGAQLEFLSRQQASELITSLNAQLHNGAEHHEQQQPEGAA